MLGRQRLHAVEGEGELRVDRLFEPERAVIVEGGDAVFDRYVIAAFRLAYLGHEVDDGLLGGPVVPGGQGIIGSERRAPQCQEYDNGQQVQGNP